jgi:aryl-alcohol dehydrogenase-like predicted oxidoreductase
MNKLAIGTVQFGLNYGINNKIGLVPIDQVREILNFAKSKGISTIDTASTYGNSEKILGEIGVNQFDVITKTSSIVKGLESVRSSFHISLKNLGQTKLEGLLVHNIGDLEHKDFNEMFKMINSLKMDGLVKKIGFSTYTPDQIDFLLANFDFDLIQVPFNVFDTRLVEGGQLKSLKNNNIEIHARSVFLQGLLLDFNSLSKYFLDWKDQFEDYQSIVKKSGLSLLEYSLKYVLNNADIDKVLVGINSIDQLKEIFLAVKTQNKVKAYPINDLNLVNPALWEL